MKMNIKGIDVEITYQDFWYDDKICFHPIPTTEVKREIIQYLYNEGFIRDRRTPYVIKELT